MKKFIPCGITRLHMYADLTIKKVKSTNRMLSNIYL